MSAARSQAARSTVAPTKGWSMRQWTSACMRSWVGASRVAVNAASAWSTSKLTVRPSVENAAPPCAGSRSSRANDEARNGFSATMSPRARSTTRLASSSRSAWRTSAASGAGEVGESGALALAGAAGAAGTQARCGKAAVVASMAAAGAVRASFSPVAACAGTPCLRARSHVAASAWPAADAAWIAASALAGSSAWGHAATVWTSCMWPAPAMMRRSSAFCAGVPGLSSGTMARRRSTSARSQSRAIMRPRKTSGAFLQTKPTTERSARGTTRLPSTSSTFASPMPRVRWRASMRRPRSKQASAVWGSRLVGWRSACHALTTAARNRSSNTVASNRPSRAMR